MDTTNSKKMYGLAFLFVTMAYFSGVVFKIGYAEQLSWLNIVGFVIAIVTCVGLISIYIYQARKNNHWLLHVYYVVLLIQTVSCILSETALEHFDNDLLGRSLLIINALILFLLVIGGTIKDKPFMQEAITKDAFRYEDLIFLSILVTMCLITSID